MIAWIYKWFLTFNSTSLMLVIYFANMNVERILNMPKWIFVSLLLLIVIGMTRISLLFCPFMSKDSIECEIKEVEAANSTFLPIYLGYFFVALSVSGTKAMIFVYGIVFVFTFISQAMYYNPLFLLFGYRFYYITAADGIKCFLISKKQLRDKRDLVFPVLWRINTLTYIDMEE